MLTRVARNRVPSGDRAPPGGKRASTAAHRPPGRHLADLEVGAQWAPRLWRAALLRGGLEWTLDFGDCKPLPVVPARNGMQAWLDSPVREADMDKIKPEPSGLLGPVRLVAVGR
ncbi:MAG: hypothetical protein FJW34_07740 [Acidobacteria bacterium]|nr:hypothetical protein [Acidobacteriota bacterium]